MLFHVQKARIEKRAANKILNNFVFFARQGHQDYNGINPFIF